MEANITKNVSFKGFAWYSAFENYESQFLSYIYQGWAYNDTFMLILRTENRSSNSDVYFSDWFEGMITFSISW